MSGSSVVSGAVVSTRQLYWAGSGSSRAPLSAFTRNVCAPSADTVTVRGDEQPLHAPPSSWHWYELPATLEKLNVPVRLALGSSGLPVSAVSTIVKPRTSLKPVCPERSAARTRSVWLPSLRSP